MISFVETEDGSHTLRNDELDETYHSIHGAIQESQHVFIDNGFRYFEREFPYRNITILEVGFGTGLNAFLTCLASELSKSRVEYWAIEPFPLETKITDAINYSKLLSSGLKADTFRSLHASKWEASYEISATFRLHKLKDTVQNVQLPAARFDIVYYDAFAPSKQPEVWTLEILRKISEAISDKGIFLTYSAKGQLKRDLGALGFEVETLPGPPGKLQMVRAIKR
ncbi:MAG: tRNA (5-methylaminomethyl-2-thiouridine)(34)-methyltransferase MnmD [Cyclobacteriaceae bacterium]